jgi:ubiquinone/menaquinone biosynthesis C-methylase UbiE
MAVKAWQLGAPGTLLYRFYDGLRRQLNCRLVDYLCANAITREQCSVLEAGSGPAFASSLLAEHCNIRLSLAVDIDLEALLEARRRDPHLSLVVADLCNLPFKDESLDLVWNSSTIEHLNDPACALAEMQRVTQQGGKVFVGVPNLYGPLGFQHWIKETSVGVWIGETFNLSQLKAMMEKTGLRPQASLFYFFRFFVGVLAQK